MGLHINNGRLVPSERAAQLGSLNRILAATHLCKYRLIIRLVPTKNLRLQNLFIVGCQ